MNQPLVSVLMVNYNHEYTLKRAIESVLNQTYTNIQFVIVDDGSTDRSCEIIQSFDDPRIEFYSRPENEHICLATNFAFTKLNGDYVARIDSDDVWYENKLEIQLKYMEDNGSDICFTWCDWIDEDGNNINERMKDFMSLTDVSFSSQKEWLNTFYYIGNCLLHSSVLMKSEVRTETGNFEIMYRQLHDFDYWARIVKKRNLYVIPQRLIGMCRFNSENTNASAITEENDTRTFNEYMDIRSHMFDDMCDETFINCFSHDFVCQDSCSKEELDCEKAFLLCRPPVNWPNHIPPAGINALKALIYEERYRKLLKEKYNFTVHDLYKMNASHMYNDPYVKQNIQQLQDTICQKDKNIQQLSEEIDRLNGQLTEIFNSNFWKKTESLRKVMGKIKK